MAIEGYLLDAAELHLAYRWSERMFIDRFICWLYADKQIIVYNSVYKFYQC